MLDFMDDIRNAQQVLLGLIQLAHGLPLACTVLRDTGCFLKEKPPFLRLAVQDFIHAVLPDNAHAIVPETRISKKLIDILQTTAGLIDVKFTFAGAEETACNLNLLEVHRQLAVIIKNKRNLRYTQRMARDTAGEDDILRLQAAQIADILLSQHPAYRIRDIALAAAIRTDNRRNALIEFYFDFVCKGLEAICLQTF